MGGGAAAPAAAGPMLVPEQFANAVPAADQLETINIAHGHVIMTWRIPRRYQNPTFLAVGGNGEVASALDTVTGKTVGALATLPPFFCGLHRSTHESTNPCGHLGRERCLTWSPTLSSAAAHPPAEAAAHRPKCSHNFWKCTASPL